MSGPGFTLLSQEELAKAPDSEVVEVTLRITARHSPLVGRFLDLIEHAAALGGIDCEVEAPGYHQVFYGWEKVPSR